MGFHCFKWKIYIFFIPLHSCEIMFWCCYLDCPERLMVCFLKFWNKINFIIYIFDYLSSLAPWNSSSHFFSALQWWITRTLLCRLERTGPSLFVLLSFTVDLPKARVQQKIHWPTGYRKWKHYDVGHIIQQFWIHFAKTEMICKNYHFSRKLFVQHLH